MGRTGAGDAKTPASPAPTRELLPEPTVADNRGDVHPLGSPYLPCVRCGVRADPRFHECRKPRDDRSDAAEPSAAEGLSHERIDAPPSAGYVGECEARES
jgi:hypothetical protein